MNTRINKLRNQSLEAINKLSSERAKLLTEFYKSEEATQCSIPVQRALAFSYILEHKKLCVNDGELIVGERGPEPKATYTYPEVSLHSMEDLEILDQRKKVSFKVDEEVKTIYQSSIIPFWEGKSNRDKIMKQMTQEWKEAYKAGVFTEFQEQRAPGHTVLGDKIYNKGISDILVDITEAKKKLGADETDKLEELKAMEVAARAIVKYAYRNASELERLASKEKSEDRKSELLEMAHICRHVPENAPTTFHEALQYYWFVHLGVITEVNPWDSFNPGRLDQHLFPFYQKDIAKGALTKERAKELLMSFWVKFNNQPAPPKMGVTAKESNTYTDFALINLGGLKADGTDAVNDLTFLILDVIEEMRLLQPSSMVQVSKKNPDEFIKRTLQITKTGFGQPSYFNSDAIVEELVNQGKDIVDARNGGASGCIESGAFGTEAYWLTGYFNIPKVLEITLHNGIDPKTGNQLGIQTGKVEDFDSFEKLMQAFERQMNHFLDIKLEGNRRIESVIMQELPVPFLSLFIDDCIGNAQDYNAGGARYNTSYVQGVGLGSITDALTSIKYHVYDNKNITLKELVEATDHDFVGYEKLRYDLIYETPKFGNDDNYADSNALRVFEIFHDAVNNKVTPRGGTFRINLLPTTCHVYFGQVMQASVDGRKDGEPLSEGISPVQGADKKGPTAVINSMLKIDHTQTGGTLLNQKFTPQFFNTGESITKLTHLIRTYFNQLGHHIQFNVVDADTLRDAQKHPEKYQDLIVRVAGYSDYFNDLTVELQEEIINRTAHNIL
ncbi:trans-4-hydroxy-L-proline dehydratase [Plebeiibacterium marinum]|uniref:Glycyl radical protein n=1 Tax=Plebeiibacterium marinum TaxID=2992111 RepID=A0AAE3MHJ5_9BACT|nr:trans-4-hydroxy-L-proline dehydratase [Plebeiobacterium marinum]MCW3807616.1 glycyl radical protein [Plebeiobacterium marinum]